MTDSKKLPLAVRLRDEEGPPLPQMMANRRAASFLAMEDGEFNGPASPPEKTPAQHLRLLLERLDGMYVCSRHEDGFVDEGMVVASDYDLDETIRRLDELEKLKWRPIDTAPMDGSRVLVCGKEWTGPSSAAWYGEDWRLAYELPPFLHQPTHWIPLPKFETSLNELLLDIADVASTPFTRQFKRDVEDLRWRADIASILDEMLQGTENFFGHHDPKRRGRIRIARDLIVKATGTRDSAINRGDGRD